MDETIDDGEGALPRPECYPTLNHCLI